MIESNKYSAMSVDSEQQTDEVIARVARTMIESGKVEAFKKFAAEVSAAAERANLVGSGPAELVAKVVRLLP